MIPRRYIQALLQPGEEYDIQKAYTKVSELIEIM